MSNDSSIRSSKSGKYRPSGLWGKVKFDVLPPQGDAEVTVLGPAAVLAAAIIAGHHVSGGTSGILYGGLVGIVAVALWRRR